VTSPSGSKPGPVVAIVVTYNRKSLLQVCLDKLLAQSYPLDGIIVIDNASEDGTGELVAQKRAAFPQIEYVRMPENLGGAGGFHEGVKQGYDRGFHFLWLVDDDAEPEEHCLEELIRGFIELRPGGPVAALFPLKVTPEGKYYGGKYRYVDHYSPLQQLRWHLGPELTGADLAQKYIPITTFGFEGLLIPAEIVARAGFPDPRFFIYFDDYEYSLRLKQHGRILLCSQARMKTREGQRPLSSGKLDWRRYYSVRNRVYIQRQIGSGWMKFIDPLLFTMESLAGAVRHRRSLRNLKLVFQAARDGWLGRLGKTIDPARAG